jgi:hypothetical protein
MSIENGFQHSAPIVIIELIMEFDDNLCWWCANHRRSDLHECEYYTSLLKSKHLTHSKSLKIVNLDEGLSFDTNEKREFYSEPEIFNPDSLRSIQCSFRYNDKEHHRLYLIAPVSNDEMDVDSGCVEEIKYDFDDDVYCRFCGEGSKTFCFEVVTIGDELAYDLVCQCGFSIWIQGVVEEGSDYQEIRFNGKKFKSRDHFFVDMMERLDEIVYEQLN